MQLPSRVHLTYFRMGWLTLQKYWSFSTVSRGHLKYFQTAKKNEIICTQVSKLAPFVLEI